MLRSSGFNDRLTSIISNESRGRNFEPKTRNTSLTRGTSIAPNVNNTCLARDFFVRNKRKCTSQTRNTIVLDTSTLVMW